VGSIVRSPFAGLTVTVPISFSLAGRAAGRLHM
jgi:hypothetical protein